MRKLPRIQIFLAISLLLLFNSPSFGRTEDKDVFAPIPVEFRAQLVERFNQFFEYGRTGQWDSYYDLLYFQRASNIRREYFIEQHRKSSPKGWSWWMVEIHPESVRRNDGSVLGVEWIIEGSVKVLEEKEGKHSFRVGAILRDGEWFFSRPSFGAPPIICTLLPGSQ